MLVQEKCPLQGRLEMGTLNKLWMQGMLIDQSELGATISRRPSRSWHPGGSTKVAVNIGSLLLVWDNMGLPESSNLNFYGLTVV